MADTVTINSLSNQYINGAEAASSGYTLTGTYDPAQTGDLWVDFQGATQLKANMVSGAWSLTLQPSDLAGLGDGVYTVTATLYPVSGPDASATAPITIDTTAPVLANLAQSASGTWTNVTSDTITVTASDGGTGLQKVAIYDNGTSLGAATLSSGAYTYTATGLTDGAHTLTAVATDVAGNTSTSTLSAVDKVDHTAPTVGALTQSISATWTSTTLDTITVTASDAASTVTSVAIYDGTTSLGSATLISGAWTYTTGSLTDGVHTFTAVATDSAGNTSTSTLSAVDKVDHTAPTIAFTESAPTSGWTNTTLDTITVTAVDSGSSVASVAIYDGSGGYLGAASQTSGSWTYTTSSLADGAHTFKAVATDNAGNTSTSTASVVDQVDKVAPTISAITQLVSNNTVNTATNSIYVTASDGGSGVAYVDIWDNGASIGHVTSGVSGVYTYSATGLTSGAHVFSAVAADNAGNTFASTLSVLDQVGHFTPFINGVTHVTDAWTSTTADTITVTASTSGGTISSVDIYEGTTDLGSATFSSGSSLATGTWTFTTTSLADGAHTFTAKATETAAATNTSTSSPSVVDHVDATNPTIGTPTQSASSTAWTKTTTNTITVTASDTASGLQKVEIYEGTTRLGAATAVSNSTGTYTYTVTGITEGTTRIPPWRRTTWAIRTRPRPPASTTSISPRRPSSDSHSRLRPDGTPRRPTPLQAPLAIAAAEFGFGRDLRQWRLPRLHIADQRRVDLHGHQPYERRARLHRGGGGQREQHVHVHTERHRPRR